MIACHAYSDRYSDRNSSMLILQVERLMWGNECKTIVSNNAKPIKPMLELCLERVISWAGQDSEIF